MRIPTFIQVVLLVAAVWAEDDLYLYSKVDGKLKSLSFSEQHGRHFIAHNKKVSTKFTLKDGIASTGEGDNMKVICKVDGFLSLGSKHKVKPFKFELDENFKVVNFRMKQCLYHKALIDDIIVKGSKVKAHSCILTEIYLMTPEEAMKHQSVLMVDLIETTFWEHWNVH